MSLWLLPLNAAVCLVKTSNPAMLTTLNTVIEPNVQTNHSKVICSTSIECIVTTYTFSILELLHQSED